VSWVLTVVAFAAGGAIGFFFGRRSPSEEREHMAKFLDNVVATQGHDKKLLHQVAEALRKRDKHA
jgi:hypothetical protein